MPSPQLDIPGDSPYHFQSSSAITINLPPKCAKTEKFIPLNKFGERLDVYCPRPSEKAFEEYRLRAQQRKVCNSYQLSGQCGRMNCAYDHGGVSEAVIEVLRYIMLQHPCSRAGSCRSIKCYFGHICQQPGCIGGTNFQCRFNQHAHTPALQVVDWVLPIEQIGLEPVT
jgi:hypothetical protein